MPYNKANDPSAPTVNQTATARTERQAKGYAKSSAISTSDTVDLAAYAGGLIVTVGGNLKILPSQNLDANPITLTGVTAGQMIPIQTRRVFATGTTASVASLDL